jgi:hypothetical protein
MAGVIRNTHNCTLITSLALKIGRTVINLTSTLEGISHTQVSMERGLTVNKTQAKSQIPIFQYGPDRWKLDQSHPCEFSSGAK